MLVKSRAFQGEIWRVHSAEAKGKARTLHRERTPHGLSFVDTFVKCSAGWRAIIYILYICPAAGLDNRNFLLWWQQNVGT